MTTFSDNQKTLVTDFADFCRLTLYPMLYETYGVSNIEAEAIIVDVLNRARMYKALTSHEQEVLNMTVWEEVYYHQPADSGMDLLAATAIIIRNSAIENIHAMDGSLKQADIKNISIMAAASLADYLHPPSQKGQDDISNKNIFEHLKVKYPRAYSMLEALTTAVKQRGRKAYRLQTPKVTLRLPKDAGKSEITSDGLILANAVSEEFDSQLIENLKLIKEYPGTPLFIPSFSRLSRNLNKLLFIIEWVLTHNGIILTTNFLLEESAVWVRKGTIIQLDSYDPYKGLRDVTGLKGRHHKLALDILRELPPLS